MIPPWFTLKLYCKGCILHAHTSRHCLQHPLPPTPTASVPKAVAGPIHRLSPLFLLSPSYKNAISPTPLACLKHAARVNQTGMKLQPTQPPTNYTCIFLLILWCGTFPWPPPDWYSHSGNSCNNFRTHMTIA